MCRVRRQVISLGVHEVAEEWPGPMLLMEVMPSLLARRSFPRPATAGALEPGFRDSPDPAAVALVFIKARRHLHATDQCVLHQEKNARADAHEVTTC